MLRFLLVAMVVGGCEAGDPRLTYDLPDPPDFSGLLFQCVQIIGDGGGDQLGPGSPCGALALCAAPAACSPDAFDLSARCEVGRCCQYAWRQLSDPDGAQLWRNCGDGFECIDGC